MHKNKWIILLFEKSGEVGPQRNLLNKLKAKFVDMKWDMFSESFIESLMSVMAASGTIQCVTVNNMIEFAASGVSMLSDHSSKDGRSGLYLISDIFRLCIKYGSVNEKVIRWRFCLFINHLLNYMSDGAVLSVELCDVATKLLLERLIDRKPEVRAQAALALNRLQTPGDSKCKVVEKYLFHMINDPSVEVRTAIIKKIAMFKNVVDEMLKTSILEGNANVRKEVFKRFLDYPFLSLSPKQRQILLEKGLADDNESIQTLVKIQLLERWVQDCHGDIVEFLEKIGVENAILCEKTLNVIFESYYDSEVLDLANQYLDSNSRVIEFYQLTVEKIFLWNCIAKFLTTEKKIELARHQGHIDDDYYEVLLPDLVNFSDYVRKFYFTSNSNDNKELVLTQLLDLAKTFAIDDVGAASLNKLCYDLILDNNTSSNIVKPIAKLLELTFKNGQNILNYIKEILNEIQLQAIDIYPLINDVGEKEVLEHEIQKKTKLAEELLEVETQNSNQIRIEILNLKKMTNRMKEINVSPDEKILVDVTVKNLLKVFELTFQVQQLRIVGVEKSLLTDIIQNVVVGYTECSMINLRMEAIHCLSPYLMNNVDAAKEYMITLCGELSKPMTNKHLVLKIMFELFMNYDLETFNLDADLDIKVSDEDFFTYENVLPFLIQCIDHEMDDNSFKIVIVQGFCDLLLFDKVKSINLITRLLTIWFKPLSRETMNLYNCLVKFFTSYMFYLQSSSSTLAKCYVSVLKEIEFFELIKTLKIQMKEVNNIFINLTDGSIFHSEKTAVNSHGELAGYILDYLLDETHSYTDMLIETLYKLKLDFNDELATSLGPKLTRVIKHFKTLLNEDRNSIKYLKKIKYKFDPILKKNKVGVKNNNKKKVDDSEIILETQASASSSHKPDPIRNHGNLFSQEHVNVLSQSSDEEEMISEPQASSSRSHKPNPIGGHGDLFSQEFEDVLSQSSDEEEIEGSFTKLNVVKRMSEMFKQSMSQQTEDDSISDIESN